MMTMIKFNLDIFSEFKYDPRVNRYRVVTGAGKGSFISKEAFLNSTERYIKEQNSKLVDLATQLENNKISILELQLDAAKILKEIHISQAILGANGVENMDASKWAMVGRELKRQYYQGFDLSTGRRFGLQHLAREYREGKVSVEQLKNRLRLYAQSGKKSFWDQARLRNKNFQYAFRTLANCIHCDDCVRYAKMGVQPIEVLPLPTQNCKCRNNCKCTIKFLTFEEAIKLGSNPN
jgi:hypothetical protein